MAGVAIFAGAVSTVVVGLSSPASATPAIGLLKTFTAPDGNGYKSAGETIVYHYTVTNTGSDPLSGISINDNKLGPAGDAITCLATSLPPGPTNNTTTCSGSYTVTQADVDNGSVSNIAIAQSTDTTTSATVDSAPTPTVTVNANAATSSISLTKSASPTSFSTVGQIITYTFAVKNTGTRTENIAPGAVTDSLIPSVTCPSATIAPGATTNCTGSYTVTQADIDNGSISNSANANTTDPHGTVEHASANLTINSTATSSLSLAKTAVSSGYSAAGQTLQYQYLVTNTGATTLNAIGVNDNKIPTVNCPSSTLASSAHETCTGSYVTTQADVDAGSVSNNATANGTPVHGATVVSASSSATVAASGFTSSISLVKSASPDFFNAIGETIHYSYKVTNTGTTTISGIGVTDMIGSGPTSVTASCPGGSLAPGANKVCTANYTTTATDYNTNGFITNNATAAGTNPFHTAVTATATLTIHEEDLTITKTAIKVNGVSCSPCGYGTAGDQITYSYVVSDPAATSNQAMSNVSISDTKLPPSAFVGANCNSTLPAANSYPFNLNVGDTVTCTAVYTVTQPDVDAGAVNNTATANGTDPFSNAITSKSSSVTVPASTATASMTIVKSATGSSRAVCPNPPVTGPNPALPPCYQAVGDTINYQYVVTNTGTETISNISVTDNKIPAASISCPTTTLVPAPGTPSTETCTATYTVNQADVNAPSVSNTASLSGLSSHGVVVTGSSGPIVVFNNKQGSIAMTFTVSSPTAGYTAAGQTITFKYTVNNLATSTYSVHSPSIVDNAGTPAAALSVSCPSGTLDPGQSTTCTASYTTTAGDVTNGSVVDGEGLGSMLSAVSPFGSSAGPFPVSGPNARVFLQGLHVTKTTNPAVPTITAAGQPITYQYTATNLAGAGGPTLTNVQITDNRLGLICTIPSLAAGATSAPCTKTYTTTQADADSSGITNTATATGTNPSLHTVGSDTATLTIPTSGAGTATFVKVGSPTTYSKAGQTINYSYTITNSGNLTINNIQVTDNKIAGVSCPASSLPPTSGLNSEICTASYVTTQSDADNPAGITNTANLSAIDSHGNAVADGPHSFTVNNTAGPAVTVVKSSAQSGFAPGQTISYSYVVSNTGGTSLNNIVLTDQVVSGAATTTIAVSCPANTLAPGGSFTCTSSYTATAADATTAPHTLTDQATLTASSLGGPITPVTSTCTPAGPECVTNKVVVPFEALSLAKSTSTASYSGAGQTINYSFTLSNTGINTITGITITDIPPLSTTPLCNSGLVAYPVTLPGGGAVTCTASYTTTAADAANGDVSDTATASGKDPSNVTITSPVTTPAVIVYETGGAPALTIVKSTTATGFSEDGDSIPYSYLVTNTGNRTLSGVGVSDPSITAESSTVTCPNLTLTPSQSETCTATYTTTTTDVSNTKVVDTATASGTGNPSAANPGGVLVTSPTSNMVTVPLQSLSLDKESVTPNFTKAGDTISYTYFVQNTGTTTITGITVTDSLTSVSCPGLGILASGASETCSSTYTTTAADVSAGSVTNTATAQGTGTGAFPVVSDTGTATVPLESISLTKATNAVAFTQAGQVIHYTYVVKNTGSDRLHKITVSDSLVPTVTCNQPALQPGSKETCSGSYKVTAADVTAGSVTNVATASGLDVNLNTITSPSSSVTVPLVQITLDKNAVAVNATTCTACSFSKAGDVIHYDYTVTDTGGSDISGVTVTDNKISAVNCPGTTLHPAPGTPNTLVCHGFYKVTANDVVTGSVTNNAKAVASDPSTGFTVNTTASEQVFLESLSLTKTASPTTFTKAGQTINYSYAVTNTGKATLTNIAVSDDHVATVNCAAAPLNKGQKVTCTGSYVTTQADADAGSVTNTASASGTDAGGATITSNTATAKISAPNEVSSISLVKATTSTGFTGAGQTINYTYKVTNTGATTISGVSVADNKVAVVNCAATPVAPTASLTCTGSYTTTAADVTAKSVTNQATASGTNPKGTTVNSTKQSLTVNLVPSALGMTKSTTSTGYTTAGQTIPYKYVVTNSGGTTLTNIAVSDNKITLPNTVSCPSTTLIGGASENCTATYTVTATDVNNGAITNTATASGKDPSGATVSSSSQTLTVNETGFSASISMSKSTTSTGFTAAGQSIPYSYLVQNSGTVTLSNITVSDNKIVAPNAVSCPSSSLGGGASETCTATYTTTAADVSKGSVTNTATASGKTPSGGTVSSTVQTVTVQGPQNGTGTLTLTKSSNSSTFTAAGQKLQYSYLVTNTGKTTLSSIQVNDNLIGTVTCPQTTLIPSQSEACHATYTTTANDVAVGTVTNTATATGNDPTGKVVTSNTSTVTVTDP